MADVLGLVVFWVFQVLNGLTSLAMAWTPATFHESLLPKPPQRTYQLLGFSPTAVEMVHNNIRGHGCALMTISVYLAIQGPDERLSYLLIGLTCLFAFISHSCTGIHHLGSPTVIAAVGSIKPLYNMLAVNAVVCVAAMYKYWSTS